MCMCMCILYICIYIYTHLAINTDSGFENHLASLGVSPFAGTKPYQTWTKPMCQAGTAQPLTEGAALHRLSPKSSPGPGSGIVAVMWDTQK